MVATGDQPPIPPDGRPGVTFAEIAAYYGKATRYVATGARWGKHPGWPKPVARRGQSYEYDPEAIARFIAKHHPVPAATSLDPDRYYTVREIADAAGIEADTIRSYITRDRWPAPDRTVDGVDLWSGRTASNRLDRRRSYRRPSR